MADTPDMPASAGERCVACRGRGWRWARGRTGEGYMVRRECPVCKGRGSVRRKDRP